MEVRIYVSEGAQIAPENISDYRQQCIEKIRSEQGKREQLAAAEALDMGLSEYGLREKDMEYAFLEKGKPYFRNHPEINFSLSHSGGIAAAAFAGGPVGIDLEQSGRVKPELAGRYFSASELKLDHTLVWTAREAFVKALGCGLRIPFSDYEVVEDCGGALRIRQDIDNRIYRLKTLEYGQFIITVCTGENIDAGGD